MTDNIFNINGFIVIFRYEPVGCFITYHHAIEYMKMLAEKHRGETVMLLTGSGYETYRKEEKRTK